VNPPERASTNDGAVVRNAARFQQRERELRKEEGWQALLELYEARAGVLESPQGRERLLFKAGEVAADQLDDPSRAAHLFTAAFEVRRSFLPAVGALRTLHTKTKNTEGLLQVIELDLEVAKDPRRRAQLHVERAELVVTKDPKAALDAYVAALTAHPSNRRPLEAIERLAKQTKRVRPLVQAYRVLAGKAKDEQAAVYHFLAGRSLEDQANDTEAALVEYRQTLKRGCDKPKILNSLARSFEKAKSWTDLNRALNQLLKVATSDAERARLLKRQALVHESGLKQPESAIPLLLSALDMNPKDPVGIKSLKLLAEKLDNHSALAQALLYEAQLPTNDAAASAELYELAAEHFDQAGEGRQARTAIRSSLEQRPKRPRALKLYERITRRLGAWKEHCDVLQQELDLLDTKRSEGERTAAVAILNRMATVREGKLNDPKGASGALARVVELEPTAEAFQRAEELARSSENLPELERVLVLRVEVGLPPEKEGALRELIALRRDRLGDRTGAELACRQLLEVRPRDVKALGDLVDLLRSGKPTPLAKALRELADAEPDGQRTCEVLTELGALQLDALEDPAAACRSLSEGLEQGEGEAALAAVRLLRKAAREAKDERRLLDALRTLGKTESDHDRRRIAQIELAELLEGRGDQGEALATWEQILAHNPADETALPACVRHYRKDERFVQAVDRLEAAARALEGSSSRVSLLWIEAAELLIKEVDAPLRAREAWREAFLAQPGGGKALEGLVALSEDDPRGLFETLEHGLPSAETGRLDVLLCQARLAKEPLGQPEVAASKYAAVRDLEPTHAEAFAALRELYRQLERWGPLADLLEAELERAKGKTAESMRRELAMVSGEHLADLPRATAAWEVILSRSKDPGDEGWDALCEIYGKQGDAEKQIETLIRVAKLGGDRQVERLVTAAEVCSRAHQHDRSAKLFDEAKKLAPDSNQIQRGLARARELSGDLRGACEALEEAAKSEKNAREAAKLHLERGRLYSSGLRDPQAAQTAFSAAIAADPSYQPGHRQLIQLLRERGDWTGLEQSLGKAAEHSANTQRADFCTERAKVLAHRLDRLDDALAALDSAGKADPDHVAARQSRVELLRHSGRPQELVKALEHARELGTSLPQRTLLRLTIEEAETRAFALGETERGRALLLDALDKVPRDLELVNGLLRVERRLEPDLDLVVHLVLAAELEPEASRRADLLLEAGRVRKHALSDIEGSEELFLRVLDEDPGRLEAIRWLSALARERNDREAQDHWLGEEAKLEPRRSRKARLLVRLARLRRKDPPAAREALESARAADPKNVEALRALCVIYQREESWEQLAEVLSQVAELEPEPRVRCHRLASLGKVYLLHLKQGAKARRAFDQALEIDPNNLHAVQGKALTLSADKEPKELAEVFRRWLKLTPQADKRHVLGLRLARLELEVLDEVDQAAETLTATLEIAPTDPEAWKLLREAHQRRQAWRDMAEAFEREGRLTSKERLQEERLRQAALLHLNHCQDIPRTADLLREVLERGDPHCVATQILPGLLVQLGREDELEVVLRRIAQVVRGSRFAAKALIQVARRAIERGQSDEAIALFEEALTHDAESEEALDELCKLHQDDVPRLARTLDRKRALLAGTPQAIKLRIERALLLERDLHDVEGAVDELGAAVDEAGKLNLEPLVLRGLLERRAQLLERLERWDELPGVLLAHAAIEADETQRAQLLARRAEVLRDRLHDRRGAIESYVRAFEQDEAPSHLKELRTLYREEGLVDELVGAWRDTARVEPERAAEALAEAGRLLADPLGRSADAIEVWEQALDNAAEPLPLLREMQSLCEQTNERGPWARALSREVRLLHEAAADDATVRERQTACALKAGELFQALERGEQAVDVLERAAQRSPGEPRLFAALDQLYSDREEPQLRYRNAERHVGATDDPAQQLALHEQLAQLAAGELARPGDAQKHWERVLALEPTHQGAIGALREAYTEQAAWESLLGVVETELAHAPPERHAALHLERGTLLEERLGKKPQAVEAYGRSHASDPSDPRPLTGLKRIHKDAQDWGDVVRVAQALRDLAEAADERAHLATEIADAYEHLNQRPQAIAALREALELTPNDAEVLARLRVLLLAEERLDEAAQILARESAVAPERLAEFKIRLARAGLLRQLKRYDEATEEFEAARELSPQDPRPLEALDGLYDRAGRREDRVEVLEAQGALSEDDEQAAERYVVAGELNREPDPERAARSFERAHQRVPSLVLATERLIELYERLPRWPELVRALHTRSEQDHDAPDGAATYLRRAAELEERRLEQPAAAAATLEHLLALFPTDEEALRELARLRGVRGEHAARAEVLGRLAELTKGEAKRELLHERAELLGKTLARPQAAAACFWEALETLPKKAKAERRALCERLIESLEESGDAEGLLRAREEALRCAASPEDARAQRHAIGELTRGPVYDPERAVKAYLALYKENPSDAKARKALEAIYKHEARHQEWVKLLETETKRRVDAGEEKRALKLWHRQAKIYAGPLQEPAKAERSYRRVLKVEPTDASALRGLENLYRTQGDTEKLATLLHEKAAASEGETRATALVDEAQAHEQLGNRDEAIACLQQARELAEGALTARVLRNLCRLRRQAGDPEALDEAFDSLAQCEALDRAEQAAAFVELGTVRWRQLERPKQAIEAYESALRCDPASVAAARSLQTLYQQAGETKDLVRVYEAEAAAKIDPSRKAWLGTRIGELREELGDPAGAERAFAAALELDPQALSARRGLVSVRRKLGEPKPLAEALAGLAKTTPSPVDRREALRELAELAESQLADLEQAVACYRQVQELSPDDLAVAHALSRVLRAKGDHEALAESLERELHLDPDTSNRGALALEASRLLEQIASRQRDAGERQEGMQRALLLARQACQLDPESPDPLGTYARVAEKLGRWQELADVTARMATLVDQPSRAGWLYRRAGKIRVQRLNDAAGACKVLLQATEVNPADRESWQALDPLSEQLDPELHVQVLRRLLQLAEKDAERAQLALRLGRHLERMQRLPEAIEAMTLARDRARGPQLLEVLGDLERLYRGTERWHDLAVVLGQRGRKLQGEARREAFVERAQILEKQLSRPDRAVETLAHLRSEAGFEERIAHEMERLLAAQGRYEELAQLFEQEARHRGTRGYEALVLLGRLCRDQLDDPERAADALQRAVAINPKGLGAVEGLRELYRKIARWPALLDTLRLEVTLVKGKTREKRMREAAEVAEDKLGDLATAARYLKEVVELAPRDARVLVSLARVQDARGDYKELVETLRRKLSLSDQPREQVVIWQRIASVYAEHLDLPTDAVAAQREALKLSPNDPTSLAALCDLLRSLRDYDELVPILQRRAELAKGAEAVKLRLEVAEVQAERQGNPDAALATAERVLQDDPRSLEAAQLMARVLRRCDPGSRDPQLATALKRLAGLVNGRERAEVLVELAGLFVRIGRPDSAQNALLEAFRADPSSRAALDPLAARLTELGRHDELRGIYEQGAAAADSEFSKAELLAKVGQLRFATGAPEAEAALRQSLELAPSHLPALQGLAQVLGSRLETDRKPELAREVAQLEERAAAQLEHPELRAQALVRAGNLRREFLGELALAARRYREALAVDPQSTEALAALAELAFGLSDHRTALPFLERALASPRIATDPRRGAELAFANGLSLAELGRREEAAASFRRALGFQPNHVGVLAALASLLQADGALGAAAAVYRTLVEATRAPIVRAEHQLQLAKVETELGQEETAVALYREALGVLPERAEAHLALGKLLLEREPANAKTHLERALTDKATEGPARLALADLVMANAPDEAGAHLRRALERPGDHRAQAARKLAEVQGRAGKWEDAVHNLKRAIELETEPLQQSELHANLARVLRDRLDQRALARRCFESALALNPHERHTLDSLMRLLESDGDVEGQVKVLGRVIKATQHTGTGDEVALTSRRAELLLKLGQAEAAAADYRRMLVLEPDHSGALAALSKLCLELGRIEELERIQRTRLDTDPLNVSSYRSLFSGYTAAGRSEEAGHALQALAVLRATNEAEAARIAFSKAPQPQAVLSDAEFSEWLLMPALRGPLATLFGKLGRNLVRQIPDDLKQHGIGWRTPRHGLEGRVFPEHPLLKQVCTVLGIRELDVYWMPDHRHPRPILAHGKVLSLVLCPQVFQGLDEPQKAFVLGRALGPAKLGLETFCALDSGQARDVVLGALKALDPARRFAGDDSRTVRAVVKAVGRADPEGLTTVGELLWSQRDELDFDALRDAVGLTSSRCGMVAAGGVWPASQALVATNLSLGGDLPARTEEVVRALNDQAEFKELLRFAVSADYARVRRRVFGG